MSQAASQAAAFYREVAESGKVWTIRDAGGYPAPVGDGGRRAQPFWSSLGRVRRVITSVPAYAGFEPDEITWEKFLSVWVPGLTRDGILVGVNWSGGRALGYDIEPEQIARSVATMTNSLEGGQAMEVPVVKEEGKQGPVPSAWRPVFRDIVKAFVDGDYKLGAGVPGVSPVSAKVAEQIESYVKDYGETLVELPDETWNSSVCIWTGKRWDTIVDLWTMREGRSDLILQTLVRESAEGFAFEIRMVYVP